MKNVARNKGKKEKVLNIPNTLTLTRIIITLSIFYFVFYNYNVVFIVSFFLIGMLTDFFDGFIARRFNQVTEFGRKFDMTADRFLMMGTVLAIIINLGFSGLLTKRILLQILSTMSREVVAFPAFLVAFVSRKGIPKVRAIGKLTTLMQAITFPSVLLSVHYPIFKFSIYLAFLTAIIGAMSGIFYIKDIIGKKR